MKTLFAMTGAAALAVMAMVQPQPAQAQAKRTIQIEVFGEDPCPRSTDDEIYVCARKPEGDRFRIPENLREEKEPQRSRSWAANAQFLETVNSTGISQCSPVGPAGSDGCLKKVIEDASQERTQQVKDETPPER